MPFDDRDQIFIIFIITFNFWHFGALWVIRKCLMND